MKRFRKSLPALLNLFASVILIGMLSGCSELNSPTEAAGNLQNPRGDLWNPQPGDEIIPGQPVPILNPGYWDSGNDPVIEPARTASRVIGITGGEVWLDHHYYTIPPGAVLQPTRFTMSYASNTGVAVDCGPSPFQFLLPVTVALSYRDTQYDNGGWDPLGLHIYYMSPDGLLTMLPSIVNTNNRTVSALTDHFSRYILG